MVNVVEMGGIGVAVLLGATASTIGIALFRWLILCGLWVGVIAHSGRADFYTAWFYFSIIVACFIYRIIGRLERMVQRRKQEDPPDSKAGR